MTVPITFDPLAPEMAIDPYPHYRRLREAEPVHLSSLGFWLLTRHADVATFFASRDLEHQYALTQLMRSGEGVVDEPYYGVFRQMVFVLDPPDHTRIRRLLTTSFTPRRVAALRPRVEAIADGLLDAALGTGTAAGGRSFDVVADFARPFPVEVIGELLGVPAEDRRRIGALSERLNPALEFLPMGPDALAQVNEAIGEMCDYIAHLAKLRRDDPGDDLFSALVHATDDDGALSEDELIANGILMYLAGHETTAGSTGLAVLALHRNPDQLDLIRRDPSILPGAVEELLRYDAPGQATARVTMAPVRFGDVEIDAGNGVVAYIGAANRDPEAYPDPDRLDLTRPLGRLTSFGGGAHLCIGHALARQELEVALATLLRRAPELKLETLDPPFRPTALMRGVASLPATC